MGILLCVGQNMIGLVVLLLVKGGEAARMVVRKAAPHSVVLEVGRREKRKDGACYSRVLRIIPREFGWWRSVFMSTVWHTLQLRLAPNG